MKKVFKYLTKRRDKIELEEKGGILKFSFKSGRSTVDVIETVISLAKEENDTWITLIFIDVRNAFNTAGWSFNNEQVTGNKKKLIYNYYHKKLPER